MKEQNIFRDMPVGKLIAKICTPVIISMIIQAIYNVVDSFYVSQLGIKQLTALGLAYPIQIIMIAISNGIGVGMNTAVSQRFGRKDYDEAGTATGNSLCMALISTVLLMLFGLFLCKPFFRLCTNDTEIMNYGIDYLSICTIACAGIFFSIVGQRLCIVIGDSFLGMLAHLSGAIFNLIFDPILIFGLLGFPTMGVKGAALATVLGQWLTFILVFIFFSIRQKGLIKIHFRSWMPKKNLIMDILHPGIPAAITTGIASIMSFGMNQILKEEAIALAIFTVFYKLWCFVAMPVNGLIQGVTPIIGFNFGARLKERLQKTIRITIICGVVMMAVVTIVFQIFAPNLITLFSSDANSTDFIRGGTSALRIISVIFIPFSIGQIYSNLFQGMGIGLPSTVYALLHQCILLLPSAYLLLHFVGVDFIWYSFWIAEFVSTIIAIFMGKMCKKKIMPSININY